MSEDDPPPPSPFFVAQRELLAMAATRGPVVDLACGRGRNLLASAAAGWPCVGIDRSAGLLETAARRARESGLFPPRLVRADLETENGLPLRPSCCGAILVFRYLHRPLAPAIAEALVPGGLLLYETFTLAQRDLEGGPSNPDFLLRPGELPALFPSLEVLHHEEGMRGGREHTARLLAMRR